LAIPVVQLASHFAFDCSTRACISAGSALHLSHRLPLAGSPHKSQELTLTFPAWRVRRIRFMYSRLYLQSPVVTSGSLLMDSVVSSALKCV
jgi:hypothetical protein